MCERVSVRLVACETSGMARSESDVGTWDWECVCLRAQRAREKNGVGLKAGGDFEFKTLKVG